MTRAQTIAKRVLDITAAAVGLVILAPLFVVLAWLIQRRIGPGSPFFRQRRPGLHGRPFDVVKFRTMTNEVDAAGVLLSDAARTPPFGWLLRRFSVDELPQLVNVLRGEMSLVGPRPLLLEYLDRYPQRYLRRHDVRPGITGWAQVHGRDFATFGQRLDMDVWYVENWSLVLDLRILWMTLTMVLCRPRIAPLEQEMDEVDDVGLHPESAAFAARDGRGADEAR